MEEPEGKEKFVTSGSFNGTDKIQDTGMQLGSNTGRYVLNKDKLQKDLHVVEWANDCGPLMIGVHSDSRHCIPFPF